MADVGVRQEDAVERPPLIGVHPKAGLLEQVELARDTGGRVDQAGRAGAGFQTAEGRGTRRRRGRCNLGVLSRGLG